MPVHNWETVDANLFHHFHQRWTIAICDALNSGALPSHYFALVEQRAAGLVPDVLALERDAHPEYEPDSNTGVVTLAPPQTKHVVESTLDVLAAHANRIVIRHRLGDVVCVIEIVPPR